MERRKRKQGKIHLDNRSLRHGSDGQRSGVVFERILESDNQGLLFEQSQSGQRVENVYGKIDEYKNKLNELKIDKLHITGPDVDLKINMGEKENGSAEAGGMCRALRYSLRRIGEARKAGRDSTSRFTATATLWKG